MNAYRVILTSPEMALKHSGLRGILSSTDFSKKIATYIVDECHCISQWGGEFRPTYKQLAELRAFVPENVPFLATSATLTPDALTDTVRTLGIDKDTCFFLNLGNHRTNIHFSAFPMKGMTDYAALTRFFEKGVTSASDVDQTMVFVDDRARTQDVCKFIRSMLDPKLHNIVAFLHSVKGARSKQLLMEEFVSGKIRVLVATESAGMVSGTNYHRSIAHNL
jgi:superfamily II DNA helicase RecQ